MLKLTDTSGTDLVASPPAPATVPATNAFGADIGINVLLIEDSGTIPIVSVEGTINWNDGTPVEVFPYTLSTAGTLAITSSRTVANGNHSISVSGHNFRAPTPDIVQTNFDITVERPSTPAPANRLLYGPILPRDGGFPNPSQWNFDSGSDIGILESSIKMLLSTGLGERVMQPDYGTGLQRLVFEHQLPGFNALVQEEIVRAVTKWEPRVSFVSLSIQKTSSTSVTVYVTFASKLTSTVFSVDLVFSA